MHGRDHRCIQQFSSKKQKEREHMIDPNIDGDRICTGLNRLRERSSGGLL
jgi:hypothetical protein